MDSRAKLYDTLAEWEKKRSMYPIHKRLQPFIYKGFACKDVNEALLQEEFARGENVLDIGCGVGNTIIKLTTEKKINGFGISISSKEIIAAKKNAENISIGSTCLFFTQSFDEPLSLLFNKTIAIESLKHSFEIKQTAANLFANCKAAGKLYIIDDFYTANNTDAAKEKMLMHNWNLNHLYSKKDMADAFTNAGFILQSSIDLSAHIIPKSTLLLQSKIFLFGLLEKIVYNSKRKNLIAIFKSGFILELLFQQKKFSYELLIFTKPSKT